MPKSNAGDIIPVLLGADLNCYNLARAFHEAYGVKSYVFGRYAIGPTKYSKIINFKTVEKLDNDDVMIEVLSQFAKEHEGKKLILLGGTDDYAAMIIRHRDELQKLYFAPCPNIDIFESLQKKADFYKAADKYGIDYPHTKIIDSSYADTDLSVENLGFEYPIIVKPSSSVIYWKHLFDGMKKVYTAKNETDAKSIVSEIFKSGYDDKIILQELIEGDDSHMRVLTAYSGSDGKVRMMCLGHVLLEEHTPKGLGNHCAIITEKNEELILKFKKLLEDIGYTGFSNFDIKYNAKDGTYRAFEINLRQGRSNYYVTAAGINLAKVLIDDALGSNVGKCTICENEYYWRAIPNDVVFKYVSDKSLVDKVQSLIKQKKESSSLNYKYDTFMNPLRYFYVWEHMRRQRKKFAIYYPKSDGGKQ